MLLDVQALPTWQLVSLVVAVSLCSALPAFAAPQGDAQRGARLFGNCAACHALEPDRNMTGPSLAGVMGRRAGNLHSFERYSPALKASGVIWSEDTLEAYLKAPAQLIPGNRMTFPGMKDDQARADLIAFLAQANSPTDASRTDQGAATGGMTGGMNAQRRDLKTLQPENQVRAISLCRDTYRVTTADDDVHEFWEPNLRFITDSGDLGPAKGAPVILPAGMMGDRASVFFATPEEIASRIQRQCDGGRG